VKLLLDSCVPGGLKTQLINSGYDVVWTGDWNEDPGDEEILATAFREGRILITLDKDFGELAIVRRSPHCGILRLVNFNTKQQSAKCLQALENYGDELSSGAIATAEPGRTRIHPPINND